MTGTPSYVAQATTMPIIGLEAAFAQPANSGAIGGPWDDITSRPPTKICTTMGTQHELGSAPTGTMDVTVRDVDEWLNPGNTTSPWNSSGKSLKPYRRIRWWGMWPLTGNIINASNDLWASLLGVGGSFADTAGFEGGTVGTWSVTAGCTLVNDAAHTHDGSKAMRVTWATTTGGAAADLSTPLPPLRAGITYTASVWLYIGSGPAVTVWCNGNTATSTATTGVWQRVTVTFVADSTITAGLGIYTSGATTSGQQVWVDSVQVEATSTASSWTASGPTVYSLFQGHIERYPLTWAHAGFEAWADLTCVDAAAMLSRALLQDVATAECLVDSPDQLWPLWDPEGTGTPQNLGGNSGQASGMAPAATAPSVLYEGVLTTFSQTAAMASTFTTASIAVVAGTTLVLTCGTSGFAVATVTSSGSTGAWTQAANSTGPWGGGNIWYANVTQSGNITVTFTFSSNTYFGGAITQWSGVAPTNPMPMIYQGALTSGSNTQSWTAPRGSYALLVDGSYSDGAYGSRTGITNFETTYVTNKVCTTSWYGGGPYTAGTQSYQFSYSWTAGTPHYSAVQIVPPTSAPGGSFYATFGSVDGPDVDGFKALAFTGSQSAGTYWAADWSAHPAGGNNAGWTLEVWFKATQQSTPWAERILTGYGPSASEAGIYLDTTGALHYQHLNTSGTSDATIQAPGLWQDGAWHHVAISETSNGTTCTSTLYVDGQAAGTAARAGVTGSLYGVRLGYDYQASLAVFVGALARVGAYWTNGALRAYRILAHWKAGRDGWAGDTPGQRLTRALSWGGWQGPQSLTGVNTGAGTLGPAYGMSGKYVSDVAGTCAATENGDFYVDQAGRITLMARANYYTNITPAWLMGENTAGGEAPYLDASGAELDPTFVYNDVTVTPDKGTAQTAYNTASQANYGTRTGSVSTSHQFNGDALSLAQWVALDMGDAILRVSTVIFDPVSNPALWPLALGIRFGDRVTWTRRAPGGTTVISGWVEQVQHDTAVGQWRTTIAIRSVEAIQAGIIGDPAYGLIGSTLVSVY